MKESQEDVFNALRAIVEHLEILPNFNAMVEIKSKALPELVNFVILEMFYLDFEEYIHDDHIDYSVLMIKKYVRELRENGFVLFEQLN